MMYGRASFIFAVIHIGQRPATICGPLAPHRKWAISCATLGLMFINECTLTFLDNLVSISEGQISDFEALCLLRKLSSCPQPNPVSQRERWVVSRVLPASSCPLWERSGSGGAEESLGCPQTFPGGPQWKRTSWSPGWTGPSAERGSASWTRPGSADAAAAGPGLGPGADPRLKTDSLCSALIQD